MSAISELIRSEADGTISFGDYTLDAKAKLDNFGHQGDLYKVKTYKDITKLERNGMFVYESVPGTAAYHLNATDTGISFSVEGPEDAQITLELEEETEYEITVDGASAGKMKTNLGGTWRETGRSSDSEMLRNDKGLSETATPFAVNKGRFYGKRKNKYFFLPVLRIRIVQMDGAVSGM